MTAVTVHRAADQVRMPWKNGLGTTLEVARGDDPAGGAMLWRVSIARVAVDGPFSLFSGYRRIISVLEGSGMVLTVDGVRSPTLTRHRPFAFDGGSDTRCELVDGPISDFNLIASDTLDARLRWVSLGGGREAVATGATALVYNTGPGTVLVGARHRAPVPAHVERLLPGDCAQSATGGLCFRLGDGDVATCAAIEIEAG